MATKLLVIEASTRPGRSAEAVTNWVMGELDKLDSVEVDLVDLKELNLPFLDEKNSALMHQYEQPHTKAWAQRVAAADAVLVVTPEYNHGYPAPLKNAFDYLSQEWRYKPIGFVSYGGMSGGLRAVEQLKQVVLEVYMVPVHDSVMIQFVWAAIDESGNLMADKVLGRVEQVVKELVGWAKVTKPAHKLLADAHS